jgi:outer membrane protein TolC
LPWPALAQDGVACQPLTLPEAIALAFQLQPRLRVSLEKIEQARRQEDIVFAAFLPVLSSAYSTGAFDLDVGGAGIPLPSGLPQFTFLPAIGAIPVGLDIKTGYELAEVKLQWLVCDFGRRCGRYHQSQLAVDIAQLQTDRAYQTIANDVAVAYYNLLRAKALQGIAAEAVRRTTDDLEVAQKLGKGGVVEQEKVLRAAVLLAQAQRALDVAEGATATAVASLNLAIGLNPSAPTCIAEAEDIPACVLSLADCLEAAVNQRRELQVARQSIRVAEEGAKVACADFAPRIVAEGYANDFQQSAPRGHADLAVGFIKLEWALFEGGKRVAQLHEADSKTREAMAEAESISDLIAFQVNQTYYQMVTARKGIDRARPAVVQAAENYRLVQARFRRGDATPSDITDAETALTRAQLDFQTSVHDYLIALARLEYAMGTPPKVDPLDTHK